MAESPAPSSPTLNEFLDAARVDNPTTPVEELTQYWHDTYEPKTTPSTQLPTLESFLPLAKQDNPDLSDQELTDYWQEEYGSQGAKEHASSLGRRALDIPIGIAKGAADIPSVLGGLVDVPTGGAYGRGAKAVLDALGKDADTLGLPRWARPSQWSSMLAESYSPETKDALRATAEERQTEVSSAKEAGAGTLGQIGAEIVGEAKGLYHNPSAVVPLISENLAQMGVLAKGVSLALKLLSAVLDAKIAAGILTADEANAILGKAAIRASAVGEGLQSAGQVSSQMDPETPFVNRLAAAAAGFGTGAVTLGVGKIPGLGDAEATLATRLLGHKTGFAGGLPTRIGKGLLAEGVLQEPFQSAQEQIWQNVAEGKPWHEGVGEQIVQGAVAGGVMGGGAAAFGSSQTSRPPEEPPGVVPTRDPLPQTAPILGADGVDDAIQKAREVTGQPGVTPEVLDQFIAQQTEGREEKIAGLTEEAQRNADQETFVEVMGRMSGLGSGDIVTDEQGITTFKGSPLEVVKPSDLPFKAEGNELTRDQHTVLSALANAFGKRIVVFRDDPAYQLPSGIVNRPAYPDVIFMARNTKAVDHFSVFAHEALHLMKGTEFHTEFLKTVFEQLTPEAKTLAVKRHGQLSDEKLLNEVASDVAGTELHKPELWTQVYKNLEERVGTEEAKAQTLTFIDHLKEIIAKIKAVIVSQPWGPRRPGAEGKRSLAEQYLKDVTKVHDALAAGVADSLYAAKHGTVQKRAERGRFELKRRQVDVKPKKQTTSKVLGTDEEFEAYTARTKEFLGNKTIPPYAKQAIMSQEMMARTNKKVDVHLSDAKWERATVFLEDLKKGNEVLWKQPSTFQHRVSMTQGPIVLDRSGAIIDGNNRVFEAIRRGDTEIGVLRPEGSEKKPSKKVDKPSEKVVKKPEEGLQKGEKAEPESAKTTEGKPTEKPILIADLHDLADERGIPWDNNAKFMDLTERTTGKRHLDDLTQAERQLMADKIKETPIQKSAQKAESDVEFAKSEASPPFGIAVNALPKNAKAPKVDWNKAQAQENLPGTPETWKNSGWGSRKPTIYKSYVPNESMPQVRASLDLGNEYDWTEFKKTGLYPPLTIVIHANGIATKLEDGHHRVTYWREQGFNHFPAWIVDFRKVQTPLETSASPAQTQTPAFKRWFGDSKVVNEDGTPKVVYHATPEVNFKSFEKNSHFGTAKQAQDIVSGLSTSSEKGGNTYPVYLRILKPMRVQDVFDNDAWEDEIDVAKNFGYDGIVYLNRAEGFDEDSHSLRENADMSDEGFKEEFPEAEDSWIAFEPTQIKSAIGNRGTFDPRNPDITASPAEPWFSSMRKVLEQKMPSKASKTQVQNLLKSPGVKEDEIKWSGIQDYLSAQPDIIDKHNLLGWLAAHNVQVEEVVKKRDRTERDQDVPTMNIEEFNRRWNPNGTHQDFDAEIIHIGERFVVRLGSQYMGNDDQTIVPTKDEAFRFTSFNTAAEAAYEEIVAGPAREEGNLGFVKYEGYTLPGGTDYTELLLKLPTKEDKLLPWPARELPENKGFRGPHFDEPNILAHVRFKTRQDGAGKNVLFLEEVQSDWHEQGREKGYKTPAISEKVSALDKRISEIEDHAQTSLYKESSAAGKKLIEEWTQLKEERDRLVQGDRVAVPDAPFKTTWPELVMKRMLRYASERNYDRLAWTTGAQQNERYGLSKHIDELVVKRTDIDRGLYSLAAYNNGSTKITKFNQTREDLNALIGKELTDRAIEFMKPPPGMMGSENIAHMTSQDLEIGGSGMKYFYDQMLPRFMEKYLKRFGTKVDTLQIETGKDIEATQRNWKETNKIETVHSIALTDDMKDSVMNEGQPLFSPAQAAPTPGYTVDQPGALDKIERILRDKNVDIKRVVEAMQAAGLDVPDELNPIYREEMYQKRVEQRAKDFTVDELRPLIEAMRLHKISKEQLDEYAHARHVIEDGLNARLKALNPTMPNNDALSGLTDAQAQNILANANKPVMDALMRRLDDMVERTRDLMVSYGLEKQATIDQWRQDYSSYVPLHREGFEEEGYPTGTGRSVRGSTVQRRGGSNIAVENILANIAQARDQILTRGEKQKPVIAFAGLMMLHPNPQLAILDKPAAVTMTNPVTGLQMVVPGNLATYQVPTVRRFDPVSQTFKMYPDPLYKGRDNVVNFRIKGVDYAIVFNEKNERAMEVAKAFKELDTAKLNVISRALAPITRYLAAINTQYNPIFGLVNFVRDAQFAMLTLSSTPLAGHQATVLKNALGSLSGIYQDARDVRLGIAPTSPMAKLWKRFEEVGGPTGYRDLFMTSTERAAEIERMLDPKSWKKIKNPIDLGKRLEETPMFQWLSDYNLTMENSIRLGVFKTAIDAGMSDLRAASLAKNITVNFNKKGQVGALMGSLYAFFNANVQGTARIAETLFERTPTGFKLSSAGKKIIVGGIVLGVLQTFALAMAGFDDHDPPEFVKQKNLIIPVPGTEKGYVMIPMPLGFNLLPNIGRLAAETMMNVAQGRPPKVMEKAASLLGTMFNTLSPTGGSGGVIQELAPTAVDPIVALATNKDWTGRAIYKEDFSSLKPTPGYTRSHDTATAWAKGLSYAINWATGGSDFTPGVLSPTPDAVDYLITQATGGIGREVSKMSQVAQSAYTGEELPAHKIPLAGRFYGSATGSSATRTRFYQNVKDANMAYQEFEGRATHKEPFADYVKSHPEARFAKAALETEKDLGVLQKQKHAMLERGATKDAIKLQEARIIGLMQRFNDLVEKAQRPPSAQPES